jgi:hypothetical protein
MQTPATLIREGIELLLGTVEEEPLLALVGQAGRDRSPDTSADHDRVLAASKLATR